MILGHDSQKEYFKKTVKKGLGHAYLFYGPEHVGKLTFAKSLAKTFFCGSAHGVLDKVCYACSGCVKIENDVHPSVTLLDLEHTLLSEKEERKKIPIEDITELKRIFSYASSGKDYRIAIINDADKMSSDAANSFLKLLEEPGEMSLFILIAPSRESLISTIASRAVPIRFSPVPNGVFKSFLEANKVRDKESILDLSFGRPGIMIRLIEERGFYEEETKRASTYASAFKNGIPELFRISGDLAGNPKEVRKFSEFLVRSLRESVLHGGGKKEIESLKWILHVSSLLESTNINPRLALDAMSVKSQER